MSDEHKTYICRCEEVTLVQIEQAIKEGATTLTGIKKRTNAGMGLCQGRTCQKLISRILAKKKDPAQILPLTTRPPVRVVKIRDLIGED